MEPVKSHAMKGCSWIVCFGVSMAACAETNCPSPTTPTPPSAETPTKDGAFGSHVACELDRAKLHASGASDALLKELGKSPFRYFRALAPQYEARTCHEFEDLRWRLPVAAVHGDAHLEQFVVTGQTFGLEDFDRAGLGPAVVDLVRYASSLRIVCRDLRCENPDTVVDRFLDAYRASLDAAPTKTEPRIVERLRAKAPQTRGEWLAWADSLLKPLDATRAESARADWGTFEAVLRELHPGRPATEFALVRVGSLSMGIGSALEDKLLFRSNGPTSSPDDDQILEAREGEFPDPKAAGCIWRGSHGDSLVLMFMEILGRRMPDLHGFLPIAGPMSRDYWVQSWDPGYQELSASDLASEQELTEVAVDAARQLAGHFWQKDPEPVRVHQRRAQLAAFDLTRDRADALSRTLAAETLAGYGRFIASP